VEHQRVRQAKHGVRSDEPLYYIAEIIDHFDLVAVQEVREDLTVLNRLIEILGSWWKVLLTDVTEGRPGNRERMAFLYDSRKLSFGGLAGEIVLPPAPGGMAASPSPTSLRGLRTLWGSGPDGSSSRSAPLTSHMGNPSRLIHGGNARSRSSRHSGRRGYGAARVGKEHDHVRRLQHICAWRRYDGRDSGCWLCCASSARVGPKQCTKEQALMIGSRSSPQT
jgi:hypothetical protein